MRAALIGQNQGQIQTTAFVYATQNGERLAFKRMMRTSDGDAIRKVAVVGSVWRFPSMKSIMGGCSGSSNTGSPISGSSV